VDTIQGTLGQALLVLVGLAVVLFAIILVLVEADCILRLGGKLARRWRSSGSDPTRSHPPTMDEGNAGSARDEQEVR